MITREMVGDKKYEAYLQVVEIFHPKHEMDLTNGIPLDITGDIANKFLAQKFSTEIDERVVEANKIMLAAGPSKRNPHINLVRKYKISGGLLDLKNVDVAKILNPGDLAKILNQGDAETCQDSN